MQTNSLKCVIRNHFYFQLSRFRSHQTILQCKMNARKIGELKHIHSTYTHNLAYENEKCWLHFSANITTRCSGGPFANLQQNKHNKANSGQVFRHHWSVECCLFHCCYCVVDDDVFFSAAIYYFKRKCDMQLMLLFI